MRNVDSKPIRPDSIVSSFYSTALPRRLLQHYLPKAEHRNKRARVRIARKNRPRRQAATTFGARFLSEVWLSPNAREKPPSDPRGVIRIARKLHLKNSVLRDGAMEQKRQAEDHNKRGREPRSERGSACRYDQNPGGVSGMADEGVGSRGDDVLAAVGLDAND